MIARRWGLAWDWKTRGGLIGGMPGRNVSPVQNSGSLPVPSNIPNIPDLLVLEKPLRQYLSPLVDQVALDGI
jgi:hypothetical protein